MKTRLFSYSLFSFIILIGCNDISISTCEKFQKMIISKDILIDTPKLLLITSSVLKNEPGCIDALLTRADLFLSLDYLDSAKSNYMKVLKVSPLNIYSLYHLGILSELKQHYDSAAYYFKAALQNKEEGGAFIDYTSKLKGVESKNAKYDISTIELLYQYGIVSYYLRDMKIALRSFELCISESYNLNEVYLYRGAIFLEMGNKEKACKDFHSSLELGNEKANNYLNQYCK